VDNLQCLTHLFSAIHFPLSISSFPHFQHFKRWPTSYTLARSVPWSQAEGNEMNMKLKAFLSNQAHQANCYFNYDPGSARLH
jgi:hypothetical protein